jgi:hypothetical protein
LDIGVVSNRSKVPLVRSRSMAMLVIKNMVVNGKIPSSSSATRSNAAGNWTSGSSAPAAGWGRSA